MEVLTKINLFSGYGGFARSDVKPEAIALKSAEGEPVGGDALYDGH